MRSRESDTLLDEYPSDLLDALARVATNALDSSNGSQLGKTLRQRIVVARSREFAIEEGYQNDNRLVIAGIKKAGLRVPLATLDMDDHFDAAAHPRLGDAFGQVKNSIRYSLTLPAIGVLVHNINTLTPDAADHERRWLLRHGVHSATQALGYDDLNVSIEPAEFPGGSDVVYVDGTSLPSFLTTNPTVLNDTEWHSPYARLDPASVAA